MKLTRRLSLWAIAAATLSAIPLQAADALRDAFIDPPNSARPRAWWHWMNGNITQDGIAKDLAWMKSVGLGGLQNFDANLATPQIVEKRLVYMTPPWKDAFRFTVEQADRLGLEVAIAASPGWSETGGPWVPPQDGLKKVVWSETPATGGTRFVGLLPAPPDVSGPYQDMPHLDTLAALQGDKPGEAPHYYADIGVFAVPASRSRAVEVAVVTATDGSTLNGAALADAQTGTTVAVKRGTPQAPAAIHLTYPTAQAISAATIFLEGGASMFADPEFLPILEARVNGAWLRVALLPLAMVPTTVSFTAVSAREFRIVLGSNTQPDRTMLGDGVPGAAPFSLFGGGAPQDLKVGTLRLSAEPRIHRFETKAGFALSRDYYSLGDAGGDLTGVSLSSIIDLTSRVKSDGTLDWVAPPGEWRILRLGYSLLGTTNHPAPPEATGLEVDKFDGPAVRRYMETYLRMYREATGENQIGSRGLRAILTDSIEVGAANWTPQLEVKFRNLRGYDPRPWLPALTGVIIESRQKSDAFLYDYRRTLADLMASEHYGTVAAVAHEQGLMVYGEALEDVRPSLGDDMAMRAFADIPMAALWVWNRDSKPRQTLQGDMKGASSVAHVYGKPYVAAESMTSFQSPWAFAPSDLRRIIDFEFAHGINRPVIHTSVHQPVDDKLPGLSLAIFGQYFNRHETWAGMARPWIDYIARSSLMLQQGHDVADVAYFYGEEQPLTALYARTLPAGLPQRHAFDFVNADILRNHLRVVDGELVSSGGARYRVLYLGGTSYRMTLPVLRQVAKLVADGATVIGLAPQSSPALGDDPREFAALVEQLWAGAAVTSFGKGRVIANSNSEAALASAGVRPDFQYTKSAADSEVLFVHRRSADAEIYFVNSRLNRPESVEARFRVSGRRPEIWRADSGLAHAVTYRIEGEETVVPLEFAAEDSFFVVFREPTRVAMASVPTPAFATAANLDENWSVNFQPGRAAPETTHMSTLAPLEKNADAGIRHFSGVATYTRAFTLPKGVAPGASLLVDLGTVGDVAEVRVNGKMVGTVWHAPYRLDIGAVTQRDTNTLEVRVANLWVNRLIGDAQPGAQKITFTTLPTYQPDAPLRPSGLIGPVRLLVPAAR